MKKTLFIILLLTCVAQLPSSAQKKMKKERDVASQGDVLEYPEEYLDTVKVGGVFNINDYSMIAVHGGATFSQMLFNPSYNQSFLFTPGNFGVSFSQYGKMFGTYPYFGYEIGLYYTHEGYKFKMNEETGQIQTIEGATQVSYDVVEVPILSAFHYDFPNFKLVGCAGFYGGYRTNIHRVGDRVNPDYAEAFLPTDLRFDYGFEGGAGIGYVFAPFEFHLMAKCRWGWQNAFRPDAYSQYYYRFASPLDIFVEAGLYFHLSRRTGRSRAMLRKEARDIVYNQENQ